MLKKVTIGHFYSYFTDSWQLVFRKNSYSAINQNIVITSVTYLNQIHKPDLSLIINRETVAYEFLLASTDGKVFMKILYFLQRLDVPAKMEFGREVIFTWQRN